MECIKERKERIQMMRGADRWKNKRKYEMNVTDCNFCLHRNEKMSKMCYCYRWSRRIWKTKEGCLLIKCRLQYVPN